MNKISFGKKNNLGWTEITDHLVFHGSSIRNLDLYNDQDHSQWILVDPKNTKRKTTKIVGIVDYKKYKNRLSVNFSQIDTSYQGHGLMPFVYRDILKNTGMILEAGADQTAGGRSIWCSLSKMRDVMVFTLDNNNPKIVEADMDIKEPYCYEIDDLYIEKYKLFGYYVGL